MVLAGLGTTLLSWVQLRRDTGTQLTHEARALEPFVTRDVVREGILDARKGGADRPVAERLRAARQSLRLLDASVLVIDARGKLVSGKIPSGVDESAVLASTDTTGARHGTRGGLAWAAASSEPARGGRRVVVVLTRRVPFAFGALRWVALSGLVAGVLAVLAAWFVAQRITGPLRQIEAATQRIASGDLTARVGLPRTGADDETAVLARSIDAMAGSLEQARGLEREFLLSISHDLRTPLTSVRGYAEAISDGAVDDPRVAAEVILRESQRLERLVADLLDLARLESRQFSLQLAPADVSALVRATVDGFAPAAAEARLALTVLGAGGTSPAVVDADRFAQVLANLIENALKFATSSVTVEVAASPAGLVPPMTNAAAAGSGLTVVVLDDGPGIAATDLPHVFERRYVARSKPAGDAPRPTGSGLGLAIARELVGAMGGTIEAGPGPNGSGTAVVVCLRT